MKLGTSDRTAMAGADNFGAERGKAEKAIGWMNSYSKSNHQEFEARLAGHNLETVKFGIFELVAWNGEWPAARKIIQKASAKLKVKTLESGYHEKRDLFSAMFSGGAEYAKVYSSGKLVGRIQLSKTAGRWTAKSESYV